MMKNNASIAKTAKRDRRWTLMFIGDRGKTIHFKNFKAVVMITLVVLLMTGAVAGGFYYLYQEETKKNIGLQKDMENLRQVITSLNNEKDILMARLVVAESRVEEKLAKVDEGQTEKNPEKVSQLSSQPDIGLQITPSEPPLSVDVEDFIVFHEPDINTLRIQYKVKNVGSKESPVSGKTVVVLKNTDDEPNKWLALPSVPLVSGKPTGQWGRSFSIFNFRTMRFKVNDQPGPDRFNTATVFVFSLTGDLLLEKDFVVGIKAQTVSTQ